MAGRAKEDTERTGAIVGSLVESVGQIGSVIDVINGMVTGYKDPMNPAEYAGEWPRNTNWLHDDGSISAPSVRIRAPVVRLDCRLELDNQPSSRTTSL